MKLRILTLPFDPALGRFDDEHLRQFQADKELLEVRDHFFVHQGVPFLTLVMRHGATVLSPPPGARKSQDTVPKAPRKEDWRDLLRPSDMPLFNTLREWRGQRAKKDGVPAYVICTNRQLAKVVRDRPQSLASLASGGPIFGSKS